MKRLNPVNFARTLHVSIVIGFVSSVFAPFAQAQSNGCQPNYIYAQRLIDETIAHHPELTALVMHMTPPGSSDNIVIASNIWLTGQKSDPDDIGVFTSGATVTETNKAGTKFEVQLVLKNSIGAGIGSVATVFPYNAGMSKATLERRAVGIRDELSRRILNGANLMEPFPYSEKVPVHTYAQQLVDRTYAKHPELLALAIHASTPYGPSELIIGSSFGRLGKPSDEDDTKVSYSGAASYEVEPKGGYEGILPLKDVKGKIIGTVNLLLPSKTAANPEQAKALAKKIGDEIASQISALPALFEPIHGS